MIQEQGIILKGVGSFYEVLTDTNDIRTCKARGIFRKQGLIPTVGDRVRIELQRSGYDLIIEILPRRNLLIRPACANIDRVFLVVSASRPEPDYILLDQLIIQAKRNGIDPVPVLNKIDEAQSGTVEQFCRMYRFFDTLVVSASSGEGTDALRAKMEGCVSCFAGQSAVGKSSLLNSLFPDLHLEVGSLSVKTERGKHTTRHAQLVPFANGAVLDTPGFSLFEQDSLEQSELDACYPEFALAAFPCRYPGCMHDTEPDCGIKDLVQRQILPDERYSRYLIIARENMTRRKHRYD